MSQFIEIFYGMETTPVKDYIDDSFPGEWGTEDKDGNGVKVIRTTNFTNSGKLNLADVVTRSIEDRKVVRKQIKKYDTILERSGGTADNPVGRVVLFEEDNLFLCNNFTQVLRFKDVDPRFAFYALYYFYQTNRTAIRSMGSKTTGIQNLNMSKYLEIGIPNASDEDQKAFVTIAEQADKSKFGDFKSQFIEMFENVESYCKLEDLVSDTFPGEWGSEPISENAIKVIRTTNFTNEGYLDLTDVVTRDIEPKKVVRKKLKQGDTILERSGGTKDNPVGRVVFFDEIGDYLPNNFTQVLRPKESVNPVYLFYALYNSYNLNKAAMRAMASQTTGIQNLSMSDFMAKFIVLPSRNEQNKFEQIYRQADKSKSVIQKALVYLNDIQSDELGKIA